MLSPATTEILEFQSVISEALGSSEARCSRECQTHHLFLADKFTLLISVVPVTGNQIPLMFSSI